MKGDHNSHIAISMGDPAGIGPEIIVRALDEIAVRQDTGTQFLVIGNALLFEDLIDKLGAGFACRVSAPDTSTSWSAGEGNVVLIDCVPGGAGQFTAGSPNDVSARAAKACIDHACDLIRANKVQALVTAPISKENMLRNGLDMHGHTEYLAAQLGSKRYGMMFFSDMLNVMLVTRHVALRDVPEHLSRQLVYEAIVMAAEAVKKVCGCDQPRIGVCGVNPHAGEGGFFGDEESEIILPAIEQARDEYPAVAGPLAADTAFYRARKGEFDALVAMYHDQALAPFKMIAFDAGVNVTLGLPVPRTSPDHGTAFNIAPQYTATPSSMIAAIDLALKMV